MTDAAAAQLWISQGETLVSRRGHRIAYRRRGRGPAVLLLHGFPTWSFDYADVADDLAADHDVIAPDFLGYGASDKPNPYAYSVAESADLVEDLVAHLQLDSVVVVAHDYGSIVAQELIHRALSGALGFTVSGLVLLNGGIVYSAYRPTFLQKLLIRPGIGKFISGRIRPNRVRRALDKIRGTRLSDREFANLWFGISLRNGHKLAHLLIRYNAERAQHHRRWEDALANWQGPLHLVWGLEDPVSGAHVLEQAITALPQAKVTRLIGVGHYPQSEAPRAVTAAVRTIA